MNDLIVSAPRVRVWRNKYGFPHATCDCGWTHRGRLFIATAITDAQFHAALTSHIPATPIDTWKAARR